MTTKKPRRTASFQRYRTIVNAQGRPIIVLTKLDPKELERKYLDLDFRGLLESEGIRL